MLKFLLALFISTASFAAQPSGAPSVTMSAAGLNSASMTIVPGQLAANCGGAGSSGCFSLYFGGATVNAGYFSPLYLNGVAYKVGSVLSSSTAKTYCFDITASASTGGSSFQLVSSTAAIAYNTNTALTSPQYQGGTATNYVDLAGPTANIPGVAPGTFTFNAQSYAGVTYSSTLVYYIHMDCFEQ